MPNPDLILINATVVTMDAANRILPGGGVALEGNQIVAVGTAEELRDAYPDTDSFDCGGRVMIPGLINAHTHAPMTLMRGLEDDRRLDVWLLGYMMPVEREFVDPAFVELGTSLACAEMIRSGITCFADMYYFEEHVARATSDAGMRAICGQTVLKFPSPDAETYEDSLAAAEEFIAEWAGHELIVPAVAPHAPYTCTADILQACADLARRYDVPLHIHVAETQQEVDQWRQEYDMPVVPWIKKQGLLEAKVIAAHCVHIDAGEMHTLEHAGAGIAHNPSSNLKLASGFAPVKSMLEAGLNVGIGTDGPSSNNDLDMFEEIRLASFVAKGLTGDPTALPALQVFEMATRLGAKAVHLDHLIGSLEPGKRADLVLVDLSTLHNLPNFSRDQNSIYARLVYATKSTDVTDVMVNGEWLMKNRTLLTVDVPSLLKQAAEYASRIDEFLIEREESVLSKLIAIGEAEMQESYEVQIKVRIDNPEQVTARIEDLPGEIVRRAHYLEYDTYFGFDDPKQGRLRHREDDFIGPNGEVTNVRYRLTLIGPAAEREFPNSVLLSRSRFIAPARHSLRFYREYFQPASEQIIHKDRLRWLVRFQDREFFINVDEVLHPEMEGHFLEIKSRTWSRVDAEQKAEMISDLLEGLQIEDPTTLKEEYPSIISERERMS